MVLGSRSSSAAVKDAPTSSSKEMSVGDMVQTRRKKVANYSSSSFGFGVHAMTMRSTLMSFDSIVHMMAGAWGYNGEIMWIRHRAKIRRCNSEGCTT